MRGPSSTRDRLTSAATADAKVDGSSAIADLEQDRYAGSWGTQIEAARVGMADRRGAAASTNSQRTHRATTIAPRNCCAAAPHSRNGNRHRPSTSTNNKTCLAPVSPWSAARRNHLSKVGRGNGERAEHQPVAPGPVRELRVVNDVRAGHRGAACPVRPSSRRCPGDAEAHGDERNPDEPAKHRQEDTPPVPVRGGPSLW